MLGNRSSRSFIWATVAFATFGRPPCISFRLGDVEGELALCFAVAFEGSLRGESGKGTGGGCFRDAGDPCEDRWEPILSRSSVSMTTTHLLAADGTPWVGPPGPNTEDTVREAEEARTRSGAATKFLYASVRPQRPATWHLSMSAWHFVYKAGP